MSAWSRPARSFASPSTETTGGSTVDRFDLEAGGGRPDDRRADRQRLGAPIGEDRDPHADLGRVDLDRAAGELALGVDRDEVDQLVDVDARGVDRDLRLDLGDLFDDRLRPADRGGRLLDDRLARVEARREREQDGLDRDGLRCRHGRAMR